MRYKVGEDICYVTQIMIHFGVKVIRRAKNKYQHSFTRIIKHSELNNRIIFFTQKGRISTQILEILFFRWRYFGL